MRPFTKATLLVSTISLSAALAGLAVTACGDDSSATIGGDAGNESATNPPPPPPPPPNPPPPPPGDDGGSDGGCGADNTACPLNGSGAGLCNSGACSPCVDPTDDGACKSAYGVTFGGSAICNQGACAPGDCHQNANCTGGKICGLAAANTCAGCSSDQQCKTAYDDTYVCNKTTGGCITNTTACTSADAGTCTGNPADICCSPLAGGAGVCQPGNCCSALQCADVTKPNCVNHVCTGCAAVVGSDYFVDPVNGDDNLATGNNTASAQCAFKTVTKALAVLGGAQATPVNVVIVTGTTTFGTAESFPIILPTNVTLKSQSTASPATLNVVAGGIGVLLSSPTSGIDYLTLDGQLNTATNGIVAQTGTSSTTTTVKHATVKNFKDAGVVVRNAAGKATGGAIAIGPGVTVTGNGTAAAPAAGLRVNQNGAVVITGTAAEKTHFDQNSGSGITVLEAGQITLTGEVGATPPTTGSVTTVGNGGPGIDIAQVPGAAVPVNTVTGLTSWGSTAGAGIRVLGGSALVLRGSSLLKNGTDGVHVKSYVSGVTVTNDVSKIDLGTNTGAQAGKNVLQAPAGANPNVGAGVCLDLTANVGQILMAQGNTFVTKAGASTDCSGATPGQISRNTGNGACAGATSIGLIGPAVNTNQVITLNCTQ